MVKKFKLSIVVETNEGMSEDDFLVVGDDVIDGFNITRTDRLGDIVSEFHMTGAYLKEVRQIKENKP